MNEENTNKKIKKTLLGTNLLEDAFLELGKTITEALDITKTLRKTEKSVTSTLSGIGRALAEFDDVKILKMPSSGKSSTKTDTSSVDQLVSVGVNALKGALSSMVGIVDAIPGLVKLPQIFYTLTGPLERINSMFSALGNLFIKITGEMERTRTGTQGLTLAAQSLSAAWSAAAFSAQQWQQSAAKIRQTGGELQQPLLEIGNRMAGLSQQVRQVSEGFRGISQASYNTLSSLQNHWGGLGNWFRSNVSNRLISEANGALANIVNGINQALCSSGARSMGLNYTKLSVPSIPYLAKGAVLPANKPFLAVVGDQKNGTNVEAPLETIKQAMAEVMGSDNREVTINFTGDLAQLARVLRPVIEKENARVGSRLITREVM